MSKKRKGLALLLACLMLFGIAAATELEILFGGGSNVITLITGISFGVYEPDTETHYWVKSNGFTASLSEAEAVEDINVSGVFHVRNIDQNGDCTWYFVFTSGTPNDSLIKYTVQDLNELGAIVLQGYKAYVSPKANVDSVGSCAIFYNPYME